MKATFLFFTIVAVMGVIGEAAEDAASPIARQILALESQAMDAWQRGDPEPMLSHMDPRITYIHEITGKRLEGIAAVRELCEPYRGRPLFDRYEIAAPNVRTSGNTAVLSYHLVTHNGATIGRWNMTQIYERQTDGWRVIHMHCSQTTATPAPATQP